MKRSRLQGAVCAYLILLFQSTNAQAAAIDVVYVLQESSAMLSPAVGYEPKTVFDLEVEFLDSATQSLVINESQANVGIALFADTARTALSLSSSASTVSSTINSLSPLGGATCISCGLLEGYNMLINEGRPSAQQAVVLLSNGDPTADPQSLAEITSLANDVYNSLGIVTFAIASVGDGLDMLYLETIAGGGGSYPVYTFFENEAFNSEFSEFAPTVPVPAAVWLFGSGLLGLIGVARRKKA